MRAVVLDGRREGEPSPVLDLVLAELDDRGDEVETFCLRELDMGSCIGCFRCWLKTPGECVEADEGRQIAEAVLHSDTVILISPVTFGGYSAEIKEAQDRWIPLLLPDFGIFHGEIHHKPRYERYPRWIGIGIQEEAEREEADLFRLLVGRNALNFHAPSYAVEILQGSDPESALRSRIREAWDRVDPWPLGRSISSLLPASTVVGGPAVARSGAKDRARRVLLIVGSPKVGSPSTSGVLGEYVLAWLETEGWEAETLTLRRSLLKEKGRRELVEKSAAADLILLVFPLYIDSLPFLLMRALEILAEEPPGLGRETPPEIAAIVNNGFPEPYQNVIALGICRRFAEKAGLTWMGGMALGAGEALFGGQRFGETRRNGLPVDHVKEALDLAASSLAEGHSISTEATGKIEKSPISLVPFRFWRRLFIWTANRHWRRLAAEYEIDSEGIEAQPYSGRAKPEG